MDDAAADGQAPPYVRVRAEPDLDPALDGMHVARGRPVLVSVGGADGMTPEDLDRMAELVRDHVIPAVDRWGAAVVDGGTDSGVMRVLGQARRLAGSSFPLVGVAAEGTVVVPGAAATSPDAAELDPGHTQVVLVPGDRWGDESPWIAAVADAIAAGGPSLTLVVNGGRITYDDIRHSLARRRPVVVVAGTGRTADAIASAARGGAADDPAADIARSPLVRVADLDDGEALRDVLDEVLGGGRLAPVDCPSGDRRS